MGIFDINITIFNKINQRSSTLDAELGHNFIKEYMYMYLMCAIEVAKQEDEGGKEKRYSLHKYKYYDIDVFVLLFLEC